MYGTDLLNNVWITHNLKTCIVLTIVVQLSVDTFYFNIESLVTLSILN